MTNSELQEIDLCASKLNIRPSVVLAILNVETPYPNICYANKPLILNERHWFHRLVAKRRDVASLPPLPPEILSLSPGGYCKGPTWKARQGCEHRRLNYKVQLEGGLFKEEAYQSISMGAFQIMGFHFRTLGFASGEEMYLSLTPWAFSKDLGLFVRFIEANPVMKEALRRKDFKTFAKLYNGPNYHINNYDVKMRRAYLQFELEEDVVPIKLQPPL